MFLNVAKMWASQGLFYLLNFFDIFVLCMPNSSKLCLHFTKIPTIFADYVLSNYFSVINHYFFIVETAFGHYYMNYVVHCLSYK